LHCTPKGEACPFNVVGFSFAGAPAVIIGHNDRIAWGFTNVGPDVMDLYIEKINPANPNQVEVNGQWQDMELLTETIQVGSGDPVEITVRSTRHGPLLSDASEKLSKLGTEGGLSVPKNYGIALRWTALEPSNLFHAILGFNLAQNWDDFRGAASFFSVPAQNLLYADVDGNIGYQMPGMIPIRANGNGWLPVPGWGDEHEWLGYVPFDELPSSYNPAKGYISTANNAVVKPDYPYLITTDWDYGYRARRIVELIEGAPGPIDIATMQKIQGDNQNMSASFLLPVLMQVALNDARLENARGILTDWDMQNHMDSAPAALFEVFRKNLLAVTFQDDLPEDSWLTGGDRSITILQRLVEQPEATWWDDHATPEVEKRDEMFLKAFTLAVDEIEKTLGKDPAKWAWGDLHLANFRNASLGKSGIAPIEAIFNRGGFRASGGSSIVNATGWNAASGSYQVETLPSMRMIIDLGDLANSLAIHTTGQSGHAYHPNYIDMADLWRNIQYEPMTWEQEQVEASSTAHLRLIP
jgi:penicillin amidase